jgi:hypothetical protein
MVDKFSGTLLPQSPDTLENQKAILDLLSKVNKLNADLSTLMQTDALVLNRTNNNNPVDGGIWYDINQNAITQYIGGAKLLVSTVLFSGVGTTISNTASELTQIGAGIGTTTIPADVLAAGTVIRIKTRGRLTTASTAPSTTFKIYLGGYTLVNSTGTPPASLTNMYVESETDIRIITVGAAGSVLVSGRTLIQTSASLAAPYLRSLTATSTAVTTKIPLKIDLTYQFGTASTSNAITIDDVTIEILA